MLGILTGARGQGIPLEWVAMPNSPDASIHSKHYPTGKFPAHGSMEVWAGGSVVTVHAHGPFNLEGVLAVNRARQEVITRKLLPARYAHITHCFNSMLISPEALAAYREGLVSAYSGKHAPLAVAWLAHDPVEGFDLLAPQYQAGFAAVGVPSRFFHDPEQAEAWIRQMLQEAPDPQPASV